MNNSLICIYIENRFINCSEVILILLVAIFETTVSLALHLLVLDLQHLLLLSQLLDVTSLHIQVLLDRVVESIHLLQLLVFASVATPTSRTVSISSRVLAIQFLLLNLDLVEHVLTSLIIKLTLSFLHSLSQVSNVFNQAHILLHNVQVVLSMESCGLLQLVVQLLVGVGQELGLCLELFLDVLVYVFLLLL